ncbi:unnamed protein product [Closterium sp. Naga37s-1]|nr:unnamed protein product [Closterium sp. Naga37s-1]
MMIAIRQPLIESLNLARERIEQRALEVGDAGDCGEIEKMKLLVRLGKLLFSVQHRPGESLSRIPSFSAQALENHMNKRAWFKVPIHRTFETHVPDSIYSKLEDMLMRDAGDSCQAAALNTSCEKYNIQVIDTEARIRYKVVCTYLAEERQFYVKKVKKLPLRYAVIDIGRPEKDVDARLILFTEAHLNTLDDELDVAIKRILEFSQIDSWTPGGLHIPAHMTEGYECSAPGYGSGSCDGFALADLFALAHNIRSHFAFANAPAAVFVPSPVAVPPAGAFVPLAQCGTGGPGSAREQQAPTWSAGDIMAECPGLLAWLSENLP